MQIRNSLLIPFFMLAAACAPIVSQDAIQSPPHAIGPREPQTVELFTAGAPARAHVDVAVFHADLGDNSSRIAKMRESAAMMGCDGLVLQNTDAGWAGTCIV